MVGTNVGSSVGMADGLSVSVIREGATVDGATGLVPCNTTRLQCLIVEQYNINSFTF